MYNPVATYRIQFHKEFTFSDLEKIIPYLADLGAGTLYASPVFQSVPGSTHGYDGISPHRINPEIGTGEELTTLCERLRELGIGWLQDIVPNHMAFHPDNSWLMDVLEKGPLSLYASFFDTAWADPFFQDRPMVPFLGDPLDQVIDAGRLTVDYRNDRLVFNYFDSVYPLHLRSYETVLEQAKAPFGNVVRPLKNQLRRILRTEEPRSYAQAVDAFRQELALIVADDRNGLNQCLKAVNKPEILRRIADDQAYRLCSYREADQHINYRRFFTVNGLIGLMMQNPEVFRQFHEHIIGWVKESQFQGLRIDHVDGLYDPAGYLEQLREQAGEETTILVEKILQQDEDLPVGWPVQGPTGYEFLAMVNNLFTLKASEAAFTAFYEELVGGKPQAVGPQIHEKKAHILLQHMGGELENLYRLFLELNLVEENALALIPADSLKAAIGQFLIFCPVYRYYGRRMPLAEPEAEAVRAVLARIRKEKPDLSLAAGLLEETLLEKPLEGSEPFNRRALVFYQRCMQFTGPLMAKGVEDTLMYTYNRFIGHNEVGDAPEAFGLSLEEFHQKMKVRQERWPLALNATSTHDTKRGEDVRARLNVLTDLPDAWTAAVKEWQNLNADLKKAGAPDANDEYFIYQTLIGAYPMPGQDTDDLAGRLEQYLEKALREAKHHSDWSEPNPEYEEAAKRFAVALLNRKRPFWKSFEAFYRKIVDFGILNSLAQVVLKATCPGVPDIYQGCELWDFSLVDPDNRRPVDFELRGRRLTEMGEIGPGETPGDEDEPASDAALWNELWENRYDGRIKLWLTHRLLNERLQQPELFAEGHYLPLAVEGRYKENVFAFARRYKQTWYVVAVPLHTALLPDPPTEGRTDWGDTRILLPAGAPTQWRHVLLKTEGEADSELSVNELFADLPLAFLKFGDQVSERGAGVLMPVTSLPSLFGVGDFGPEARAFADFLSRSRQKFWQLLPVNPTGPGVGFSPYSTYSSMAGNTLLISPEALAADGLLDPADWADSVLPAGDTIDYKGAEEVKKPLFVKAWRAFREGRATWLEGPFREFCDQEAAWLDDFALYTVLKQVHRQKPWYEWPEEIRKRELTALSDLSEKHAQALDEVRWFQFIFARQWHGLRTYCNQLGIQLFGDLPFYVSYDSVDVWANPELFSLDEEGRLTAVAGVPPDYFNADGQLWGMPVFRWDRMKEQGYDWWIRRIRKNRELYDLVRIDHFRAMADYWEVPAGEKTAIHGEWKPGPGHDFFEKLEQELGPVPLVAEDLGDISEEVYELRDAFGMPGMKVIQFAFGDVPGSPHFPHNYAENFIAYTGTHDNNTVRGWFARDADPAARRQAERYAGVPLTEENVHEVFGRLVYASVAKTVILPVQDVLGLDETARINTPAEAAGNWLWRLRPGRLTEAEETRLREWAVLYNRV
ncbi:malto-oligosyltrehalose synthase [Larkinella soli]|uniref:malto-oligosyltrehalose synthase n=1 Tax=Larkinella soli TaxID=1770527 RepID=UPI000FFC4057|nr:malto-oligosyltrehalose synthase [Larkinella soli]